MKFSSVRMACAFVVAASVFLPAVDLSAQSAEAAVIATIDAYHKALASGDSTTALSMLADDVTILE